jgi:hypothetical protein
MTRLRPSSHSARRPASPRTRKRSPRKTPAGRPRTARASRQAPRPVITVVLFDLDDTLYDCFGQRVVAAHRNASRALAAAGLAASAEEILKLRLAAMEADPRLEFVDLEVGRGLGVPLTDAQREAAQAAYFSTPVGRLHLFPGALELLRHLKRRGVRNFIVSFGEPQTQRAKVAALAWIARPPSRTSFTPTAPRPSPKRTCFAPSCAPWSPTRPARSGQEGAGHAHRAPAPWGVLRAGAGERSRARRL